MNSTTNSYRNPQDRSSFEIDAILEVRIGDFSILSNLIRRKQVLNLLSLRALRDMPKLELQDSIRCRCNTVMMTEDTALCRTLGRYKMFVDKGDLGFSPHIMLDGFWQVWVTRAILKTVREGMSVMDVGASVGYYTLLLADLVGKSGHVHAIEPNDRAMKLLQQSVAVNGFAGRVILHDKVHARAAQASLSRSSIAFNRRKAPFARTAITRVIPSDVRSSNQQGMCLDEVVNDQKLDFIKIDGRFAGRDTWRGMQRILAREQPLIIMFDFIIDAYRDPDTYLSEIIAARFKLARVDASGSIVGVSAREILALPPNDTHMLLLSR